MYVVTHKEILLFVQCKVALYWSGYIEYVSITSRVSTLPLYQEAPLIIQRENETMAPLHVATLTIQRELHKY